MMGYDFFLRLKVTDRWEELEKKYQKPLSMSEMVMYSAIKLVESEKRMLAIQEEQSLLSDRITEVEAKISTKDTSYYTISGYARLRNLRVDRNTALKLGKQCSSICNNRKIAKGREYDAKYGEVNTYPFEVLSEVFDNYFDN